MVEVVGLGIGLTDLTAEVMVEGTASVDRTVEFSGHGTGCYHPANGRARENLFVCLLGGGGDGHQAERGW